MTFKVKYGDKDKNNKLTSLCIDDDKLLEKFKTIWTRIEDLKNIKLNALPFYDDRYIKIKIRTYGDKVYTKFCGLNMSGDGVEWESFTIISIDSLLVYENKYYLQLCFDNSVYKIVDKQMTDYLDDNIFETDANQFLDFGKWVLSILYYDTTDLSDIINPAKSNNSKECIICRY